MYGILNNALDSIQNLSPQNNRHNLDENNSQHPRPIIDVSFSE